MSIQTELTRLTNAKAAIKTAIEGKGVTVPDTTLLDGMASLIESIEAGTRINHNGSIKRAAVDLWDTEANNPDNAPTLWEDILYRDGYRIIPDVITAGTAFALDELGWWGDKLYKSLLSANVYTPEQYPNGWELQE